MDVFEIPLTPIPKRFEIALSGIAYQFVLVWRDAPDLDGGWTLDINDVAGNPLVCGIPLVTGADLLAQYDYLGFRGCLYVATEGAPEKVPSFTNLGLASHLYWIVA